MIYHKVSFDIVLQAEPYNKHRANGIIYGENLSVQKELLRWFTHNYLQPIETIEFERLPFPTSVVYRIVTKCSNDDVYIATMRVTEIHKDEVDSFVRTYCTDRLGFYLDEVKGTTVPV